MAEQNNIIEYAHFNKSILGYETVDDKTKLSIHIDSEFQNYLKDHVFGGESFVPATMIIELLFEAAFYYCEKTMKMNVAELKPIMLKNFDIQRALKMKPGDSIDADFIYNSVEEKEDGTVLFDIEIASNRLSASKKVVGRRVNVKSKVVIGKNVYPAPDFKIPDEHYNYYQLNKANFYKTYFPSLGKLFQTAHAKFAVNDERTHYIAEYNCDNNEASFIQGQTSHFITSPLGNDSTLQAAVFFSRMINLIGRLPVGGEELYFYRKHPLDSDMHVYVEKVDIDDNMTCNIYSYDKNGVVFSAKNFVVGRSPYHKLLDRETFEKDISTQTSEPFDL